MNNTSIKFSTRKIIAIGATRVIDEVAVRPAMLGVYLKFE